MEPRINTDKHSRITTHTITHNLSLTPVKSVKFRRKPLSDNRLYLQMAEMPSVWEAQTARAGKTKSPGRCRCRFLLQLGLKTVKMPQLVLEKTNDNSQ